MNEQTTTTARMEIGISTFLETTPDVATGKIMSHAQRLRDAVEEIVLADEVGLDVYGIGEHHRADYAGTAPAVVLAAAAPMTKRIRLTSAVTVLSSDDPVRVYQAFSTLDGLSNGRAEIMAGRGSFIESFPLFGRAWKITTSCSRKIWSCCWRSGNRKRSAGAEAIVPPSTTSASTRAPCRSLCRYGSERAATLSPPSAQASWACPIAFAIIGGMPESFAPLVSLYKEAAARAGHDPSKLGIATHSHGFVGDTTEQAADLFYAPTAAQMNVIGRERGWGGTYDRAAFDAARSLRGALYVGDPEYVAEKILLLRKNLGVTRFFLHVNVGTMPHREVLRAIELLGTRVAPIVRKELERIEGARA